MVDPNFAHAVVLVLEHNEQGALGVVLNRASDVEAPVALPGWGALATSPQVMFVGGPVQPNAIIGLARADDSASGVHPVVEHVAVVDLDRDPADLARDVRELRLFVGYSGWDAAQLDAEIARGDWFLVDPRPEDVFTSAPDELWRAVLVREGGLFRTIPENPSLN